MIRHPPRPTLFPSPPLFRSNDFEQLRALAEIGDERVDLCLARGQLYDEAIHRRVQHPSAGPDDIAADCVGALGPHLQLQRSEEHTSELQSQSNLVCRLLLEK